MPRPNPENPPAEGFPDAAELGILTEAQEAIASLATLDAQDRGPGRAGDEIGEVDLGQGVIVRRRRASSMVRMGGRELPARVKVYDRLGNESFVPTVQLAYHLSKRDNVGRRVFFSQLPPGVKKPEPIKETCSVCLGKRNVHKKFYEYADYVGHMETLHPREWRIEQEQRGQAVTIEGLIKLLASLSPEEQATLRRAGRRRTAVTS